MTSTSSTLHIQTIFTGAKLKSLRHSSGLTQDALAYLLKISTDTLRHWEKQKGPLPNKAQILLTLFKQSPESFVD